MPRKAAFRSVEKSFARLLCEYMRLVLVSEMQRLGWLPLSSLHLRFSTEVFTVDAARNFFSVSFGEDRVGATRFL